MCEQPGLADLERLYRTLTAAEREELLEALLVAASKGSDAVMETLEALCLVCAARGLVNGHPSVPPAPPLSP